MKSISSLLQPWLQFLSGRRDWLPLLRIFFFFIDSISTYLVVCCFFWLVYLLQIVEVSKIWVHYLTAVVVLLELMRYLESITVWTQAPKAITSTRVMDEGQGSMLPWPPNKRVMALAPPVYRARSLYSLFQMRGASLYRTCNRMGQYY